MYFSPYIGDTSSARVETAQQALAALKTTLSFTRARAGNRPLFIFEYEIVSNSPEVATNPALPASEVPPFILASSPILRQYTSGYSLWTYHDYTQSPLYNPSFSLGTDDWTVAGSASPVTTPAGSSLSLGANASVSQTFPLGYLEGNPGNQTTVSLSASALTSSPTTLHVSLARAPTQSITVRPGQQTYTAQFPTSAVLSGGNGQLSITATAPSSITNVQVFNFTQLGDVYGADGTPGVAAAPLRTLNQQLAAG
jgi:hypothetical protein